MYLKDFLKRSVVKVILVILFAWLVGPHSPLSMLEPLPDPPKEVGAVLHDDLAHGSGSYHDPYQLRLRI